MRYLTVLFTALSLAAVPAHAEVVELEGEELLETYVTGISLEQEVTDTQFSVDADEQQQVTEEQQALLATAGPSVSVSNLDALGRQQSLDALLAGVTDAGTRDLVEDAITQTAIGPRLDINLDRVASETGITPGTPTQDFQTLRNSLLELMPISTGYQFEFNNRF